jgi:hypothetical protein
MPSGGGLVLPAAGPRSTPPRREAGNRPPRFTRVDFGLCDPRRAEATAGASVRLVSVVLTRT